MYVDMDGEGEGGGGMLSVAGRFGARSVSRKMAGGCGGWKVCGQKMEGVPMEGFQA